MSEDSCTKSPRTSTSVNVLMPKPSGGAGTGGPAKANAAMAITSRADAQNVPILEYVILSPCCTRLTSFVLPKGVA